MIIKCEMRPGKIINPVSPHAAVMISSTVANSFYFVEENWRVTEINGSEDECMANRAIAISYLTYTKNVVGHIGKRAYDIYIERDLWLCHGV